MQFHTRVARVATALALTGALGLTAACGSGDEEEPAALTTASNGDVHNEADVEFAQQMIPHHAQALQMVVMTQGRELSPEVAELAEQIRGAQTPEVQEMTGWLQDWDEEVPETSLDHVNAGHGDDHGDGGGHDGMGMMSAEEMQELEDAPDAEFEQRWLEMMTEHHEGAVEMARTELEDGHFADAKQLAEAIEESQTAEIEEMKTLLG